MKGHARVVVEMTPGNRLHSLIVVNGNKRRVLIHAIENPRLPGFRHNIHSFFHRAVTAMPWYRDLELQRHGARYVEPELNVALILPDGRSLQWWTDLDKTVASFAEFSRKDAAALRRLVKSFQMTMIGEAT